MKLDSSQSHLSPQAIEKRKIEQILDHAHLLCRDDMIWILEYIKKKVAERSPQLLELSQPRLLQNFHHFAEISLMLIHRRGGFDQEADQLKAWISEAISCLQSPPSPSDLDLQSHPTADPPTPGSLSFPSN
jgi:hypothetical protein